MIKTTYTVYSDEHFHLHEGDDKYRTTWGEFVTYEEAVDYCQLQIRKYIDEFSTEAEFHETEFRRDYYFYGEDYWISPQPEGKDFSADDYMEQYIKQRKDFV